MKYLKLMRVKHYLKNVLVALPVIFAGVALHPVNIFKTLIAFITFSLTSSIIYIINDIRDVEKDRKHPVKKKRPIASGEVSIKAAVILAILLFVATIAILYLSDLLFNYGVLVLLVYFVLNLGYSFGLKDIPLVDITILASGFVLRVLYGGLLLNIDLSNWLFLTVLSGSFYMALGKRRNELIKLEGKETRKVLKYYTKEFLDKNMYMFLSLSIVFYSLWSTLGVDNRFFKFSSILVILILMKYSLNVEQDSLGDPIEVILGDKILIILAFIYAVYCFAVLYI
ncbi:MAG: decaprenyl-phosphate phosphoribosyltransferase [Candidatus Coprovivens sp.]